MKVLRIILAMALVSGMAVGALAFDGNGSDIPNGIHGYGAGDGTGPIHDVLRNENAITITGTVADIGANGEGLKIDTGDEIISVYGVGPLWYWKSLGVDRPVVRDSISVDGREVTFSDGTTKIIAKSIIIGDATVDLRDSDTGLPLWRQSQQPQDGMMQNEFRKGFRNQYCPAAAADEGEAL